MIKNLCEEGVKQRPNKKIFGQGHFDRDRSDVVAAENNEN